ncbi:hypothetical protein ACQRC6_06315 [Peptoniphilus sp. SGI.035]|uniref:hypothetical protein n=1 Tax=unclassified Peptoniphilus TaxID=2637196 RepID=UPI0025F76EAF|nr:hypothetical protein [Peptoniphilus sp.]MCI5643824.1 hypothetical protein [Peptoniphilus sp.]
MISSISKEKFENYGGFVEKFKTKKTTDDCYTPPEVYKIIKDWVVKEYEIDEKKIVRPFYPGGDYKNFDYRGDKIVIDNPPFSILSKIKNFYCENNIKFFLFAPHLTLFSGKDDKCVCYIVANANIKYNNKAKIPTSFVTNLDKYRIRLIPKIKKMVEKIQTENKKPSFKYVYPKNVISAALLCKYIDWGIELNFKNEELFFIRRLDAQKKHKKQLFGSGYLISDEKANFLESLAVSKRLEDEIVWELSEREEEIVKGL